MVFFFVEIFWCLSVSRAGRIVEEDGGTDGSEVGNGERRNGGTQARTGGWRRERVAVGAAAAAAAERVVVTAVDEEETTVVATVGRSSARDGERAT